MPTRHSFLLKRHKIILLEHEKTHRPSFWAFHEGPCSVKMLRLYTLNTNVVLRLK